MKEFRAKVFKSGNSMALRLPKALGFKAGEVMVVREARGKFEFEPAPVKDARIDLTGIWGSVPGLKPIAGKNANSKDASSDESESLDV